MNLILSLVLTICFMYLFEIVAITDIIIMFFSVMTILELIETWLRNQNDHVITTFDRAIT
jgi:hypothetical protein